MKSERTSAQMGLGLPPESGSVWLELRVRWEPLKAVESGKERALLFPANHLNHLQVAPIPNP